MHFYCCSTKAFAVHVCVSSIHSFSQTLEKGALGTLLQPRCSLQHNILTAAVLALKKHSTNRTALTRNSQLLQGHEGTQGIRELSDSPAAADGQFLQSLKLTESVRER